MAYPSRRRASSARLGRRTNNRKYRWLTTFIDPTLISPGTAALFPLLTPILPPATQADTVYQSMTTPTLIAVQGQVTLSIADITFTGDIANPAWGLYVDEDASNVATALLPYSQSNTTSWMMWHTTTLFDQSLGTNPATDIAYRRYEFTQRKYKRKMDSSNDTLAFVVENPGGTSGDTIILTNAYFRLLLLE